MGVDPTPQQAELFQAVQVGSPRIAAKSGHGVGKSAGTCIAGAWRTFQHVDALTMVTSPTMRQCRQWLTEFGRILDNARNPLMRRLFKPTKSQIVLAGREKWRIGFVTATKPEAIQGIHQENLTFILDEASGIEDPFLEAIAGTLTNQNSMEIAVGNPNLRDCGFFRFFSSERARWTCMTFNSEDSPLTSKDQIQFIIDTYGRDSDVFRVRVLGEFPHMDPNCIISVEEVERCLRTPLYDAMRVPRKFAGKIAPAKQFGIDYARFGGDENVIAWRSGQALMGLEFYPHTEPRHINKLAFKKQLEAGWTNEQAAFCADANGLGDSVMVDFKESGRTVHEFKAQQNARRSREYSDKITEAWFTFAQKCKKSAVLLKNDPILIQQLTTRQYDIDSRGRVRVESKDKYMKRGFPSPDRADAVVMCYYDEVEADTQVASVALPRTNRFETRR